MTLWSHHTYRNTLVRCISLQPHAPHVGLNSFHSRQNCGIVTLSRKRCTRGREAVPSSRPISYSNAHNGEGHALCYPCATHPHIRNLRVDAYLPQVGQKLTLRPYQQECLDTSLQLMRDGVMRQAVSLPVGSGKTVVFAHMIPRIPRPNENAYQTLVLAHRTELLEQAAAKITMSNPGLSVSIEKGKEFASEDADVVVASVPTLGRKGSTRLARFDPRRFKCIIIDEAHHASANTYLRILEHFGMPTNTYPIVLWGCTATLRRHDGLSLGSVFDTIGYSRTLLEMWEEGWLCSARPLRVETNIDLTNVRVTSSSKDFSTVGLSSAINTAARNHLIVEAWKKYVQSDNRKSCLVFCVDVTHVKDVQAAFVAAGVPAYYVDGTTPKDERASILENFRAGRIPVLINCGVFTEGTDIPCIDSLIMARPTKSSVLFQQMLGRGLRISPGKQDCLVLDFTDNFGHNTIITLPSLLGLVPDFDAHGEDIYTAYQAIGKLAAETPEVILAKSLDDAASRVKRHQRDLRKVQEELETRAAQKKKKKGKNADDDDNIVETSQPEMQTQVNRTNYSTLTALAFVKYHDEYFLKVEDVGSVRLTEDDSGFYRGRLLIKGSNDETVTNNNTEIENEVDPWDNSFELPLKADTLESAFSAVKSYLEREFPREMHRILNKKGIYSNQPATDKQLTLLSKLTGGRMPLDNITKGKASMIIDNILNPRKTKQMFAAEMKRKAKKAAVLRAGLVPKL